MKRSRNDRNNRTVLLLCLMLFWGLCPDVRAEEPVWKEYRTTAAEGKLSYDPKSVAREDSVVDVWSRFEPVADERIREMKHWVRFDCARKRMKLLTTITVYHDGSVVELPQKNKFEAIDPGSNPAFLSDEVCGGKKEPVPQEPVAAPVEKPVQEVRPTVAPIQVVPQEPVAAPVEKPIQEVQPPVAPAPAAPQEPATAPVEKPVQELQPATAPVPTVPQEPVKQPIEKPLTEVQPHAPSQQEAPPVQTPPAVPAALPQ